MISKKSRKQVRKELRKQKKARKNEYYTNRSKGKFVLNPNGKNKSRNLPLKKLPEKKKEHVDRGTKEEVLTSNEKKKKHNDRTTKEEVLTSNESLVRTLLKEKREQKKLQKQMDKQRMEQLKRANIEEDRNIKQLEKQLKLHKRKTKGIPKSFVNDGLDLEVCDSDGVKGVANAEKSFFGDDNDFEEDFALMTGKTLKKKTRNEKNNQTDKDANGDEMGETDTAEEDGFFITKEKKSIQKVNGKVNKNKRKGSENDIEEIKSDLSSDSEEMVNDTHEEFILEEEENEDDITESEEEDLSQIDDNASVFSADESEDSEKIDTEKVVKKRKYVTKEKSHTKKKKLQKDSDNEDAIEGETIEHHDEDDGIWEDIYGRLRGKDGSIVQNNERKYIPPAVRAKLDLEAFGDEKNNEKLNRLKKQLKGLINRLAEVNMHKIATEIEQLYMNNSRNDMNVTLTNLIFEALIGHVLTPERFVLEHVMLIAILHANVGMEVGAHFLQNVVKKFEEVHGTKQPPENKILENIVQILSHLYNFKVYDAKLLYEILEKLNTSFEERDVECILLILKSVGFSLRKDDPLALKRLIINIQQQAMNASKDNKDNPRVKFMLEILLAIKNNNMTKIPNYDTTYAEHLKKLLKGFIRKGLYVSTLNICLDDLLKADERGKWWVVGSAWSGKDTGSNESTSQKTQTLVFSQQLLELAKLQRMNTDTRRNIFCIIMSAEDYLDAFEKLLHLGLKNQQEREIIHVLIHCCLQEKVFNPYYAYLTQKFCEYDRRFQLTIKYSVWDKLKALSECSGKHLSNLAKLLTHLFLEKSLPISILKIMQFSELDKVTLRFVRQILFGILLYEDSEQCQQVFEKVSQGEKLKMFRESIRLFIKHFLLRNLKNNDSITEQQKHVLEDRANMIDKILSLGDKRITF